MLRLFDRKALIAQLTPDGRYLDRDGHEVGLLDSTGSRLTVEGIQVDLRKLVVLHRPMSFDLDLRPLGRWHVQIDKQAAVRINGQAFGRIEGFVEGRDDLMRAATLMIGFPFVPSPRKPKVTRPAPRRVLPPPPPPPPPRRRLPTV